ncbi:thiamine diphosphokinase [Haliovirga abyssi]|uniref:Thiamine diphosphokinase n=1 Tax=Haliovirga abyssi TaxID=2996794 RepID=A0AAU9DJ98_9FUSO|nr:thiamine diphosphokinase [Haliovirga abyssi]BDU50864.1 thiamine pyrophosphokinase [Haliovirga abyssi]
MKKAVIFLNLEDINYKYLEKYKAEKIDIFCADGGAKIAYKLNIIPKMILGDFDSLSGEILNYYIEKGVEIKRYNPDKDKTDTEILLKIIYKFYDEIILEGAIGGRVDHTLVNINLLNKFKNIVINNQNEELRMITKREEIYKIKNRIGDIFSIIPFSEEIVITLNGFKYNIENKKIKKGDSLGISNLIIEKSASIKMEKGKALAVVSKIEHKK